MKCKHCGASVEMPPYDRMIATMKHALAEVELGVMSKASELIAKTERLTRIAEDAERLADIASRGIERRLNAKLRKARR